MTVKRKVVAGIAGAVLAVAGVAVSSASASAERPAAAPAAGIQAVAPGTATLRFDWGCDGSYSSTTVTFNADGTFTSGASAGVWVIQAGMLTFQFNGIRTTYSSVIASSSGTGIQSTFGDFGGVNGCHLLLGPGSTLAADSDRGTEALGVDGR